MTLYFALCNCMPKPCCAPHRAFIAGYPRKVRHGAGSEASFVYLFTKYVVAAGLGFCQ